MKRSAICGLSLIKKQNETFGWWGFGGRHHPQQQQQEQQEQQTTSLADVNPVWYHFDRNVRTIEWFSLFIIKTALDRNRRVVFTNTFLFLFLFTGTLPTYSKQKTTSIISLIKQLVATRRTTSQRLWCYSLTLTILRTHPHPNPNPHF